MAGIGARKILPFRSGTSTGEVDVQFARDRASFDDVTEATERRSPSSPSSGATAVRSRAVPVMDFGDSLRLRYPLFVLIEESDGAIVASSYDLEVAEFGVTEFEALAEFKVAVVELYEAIREMGADAPAHLASKRRFLDALAL